MVPSAVTQIAAMEAKLASMQKRKPVDEDYIPGQIFSTASGSASPALQSADEEMDLEEEMLGEAEARRAAEKLEKEMMDDLGDISGQNSLSTLATNTVSPATAAPATPVDPTVVPGLPPKPAPLSEDHATSRTKEPAQILQNNQSQAFQKGLAGLPKKPAFQ